MTRSIGKHTVLLLGLILLASAAAFTSPTVTTTKKSLIVQLLEPSQMMSHTRPSRLHAETDEQSLEVKSSVIVSAYDDGDPRQALEQFGSLFSQVQAIVTEGSNWDADELENKTREFARTYVGVVVPGLGYASTSLAVYVTTFATIGVGLALSGRGYNDIIAASSGFEPLRALLEKADPTWGNVAIALVLLEVLSPVILALTLALTPKTMDALRTNLDEWGWGEEGIDERVAEMLGK